jgi:hypothetical protein
MEEPIVKLISSFGKRLPTEIVTTAQILDANSIQDSIDESGVDLRWQLRDGRQITNSKENFLLNRILHYNPQIYQDFAEVDQFYVRREFEAYLGFALNSFHNAFEKTLPNGFIWNGYLSLLKLWQMADELELATPDFQFSGEFLTGTDTEPSSPVIQKSIFDSGNWRPSSGGSGRLRVRRLLRLGENVCDESLIVATGIVEADGTITESRGQEIKKKVWEKSNSEKILTVEQIGHLQGFLLDTDNT